MSEHDVHNTTPYDKETIEELKSQVADLQAKIETLTSAMAGNENKSDFTSSPAEQQTDASASFSSQTTQPLNQGYGQTPYMPPSAQVDAVPPQGSYAAPVMPAMPFTPPTVDPGQNQAYYGQQTYSQPVYTAPSGWTNTGVRNKDHVAASLLAIFLGVFGVHKFYLGYNTAGFIMLAVSLLGVLLFFVPSVVVWLIGLIEGIVYLTKSQEEFDFLYVRNKRLWF